MTEQSDEWLEHGLDAARDRLGGAWTATRLHGTGGGQYGSGVVRLRSDDRTVVVKVIRRNDAAADDPASWRREVCLYSTAWLDDVLPEGLTVPACRLAFETDHAGVIVLDDVPFDDPDARSADWYAGLADRLGRLAARPIEVVPEWASRGFVAAEVDALATVFASMSDAPSPHIASLVDVWRSPLARLIEIAPAVLASLDGGPQGFNHNDAFSRNAASVGDRFVMIDWAYAGVAPVGTDAAGIVAMTAMHADVDRIGVRRLFDAVVEGYVGGAVAVDPTVDGDALRAAIEALLVLRWSGFLTQVHAAGDALPEIAQSVSGRPFDEVMRAWETLSDLVGPMAERVLRSA